MFEIVSRKIMMKMSNSKNDIARKLKNKTLKEINDKYPEIMKRILEFSNEFAKLKDTFVFEMIADKYTLKSFAEKTSNDIKKIIEFATNTENAKVNENRKPEWLETAEFIEIDARKLSGFFLKDILKKLDTLQKGEGLKVIQNFFAAPLINLVESKGFESYSEKISDELFHFYFYKKENQNISEKEISINTIGKPEMVIQSATPVIYPVISKILKSEEIRKNIDIKEVKVWEETEKHLGWIVNGKADLSFSAVLAMSNLANNKDIVKLTAVSVWDNFYLLTRNFVAKSWEDLLGKEIFMPLFFNAPPAKITSYLMLEKGFNPKDFNFVFGKPFGRPEEIYRKMVNNEIDVALLREPEASYALVNNSEINCSFSYSKMWKELHPKSFGLPNAGVVFKKEWFEKFPEEAELISSEIEKAIDWIKENKEDAAKLSYAEMNHSYEEVLKFVNRVHYEYIPAVQVKREILDYLTVIDGKERAELAVSKMI